MKKYPRFSDAWSSEYWPLIVEIEGPASAAAAAQVVRAFPAGERVDVRVDRSSAFIEINVPEADMSVEARSASGFLFTLHSHRQLVAER